MKMGKMKEKLASLAEKHESLREASEANNTTYQTLANRGVQVELASQVAVALSLLLDLLLGELTDEPETCSEARLDYEIRLEHEISKILSSIEEQTKTALHLPKWDIGNNGNNKQQ